MVILSDSILFYKRKRSGFFPFPALLLQFRVFTLQLLDAQHHAAKLLATGSGTCTWSRLSTRTPLRLTTLAGTPTAVESGGISSSTTAPAAMLLFSPP